MKLKAGVFLLLFAISLNASVGKITALTNKVVIIRDGININTKLGMAVYKNDTINSTNKSKVQILFSDDTVVSLGGNSAFKIEDYLYSKKNKKNSKIKLDFFKGKFKVVTGLISNINKERFQIKTKTAKVGVNAAIVVGNQNAIGCLEGIVTVSSLGRTIVLVADEYTKTSLTRLPTKAAKLTPKVYDFLKIYIQSRGDSRNLRKLEKLKTFYWGETTKLDISKEEVKSVINEYVSINQPQKVQSYKNKLKEQKQSKINRYKNTTFANKNLMWQDNKAILSKKLNILESKIYCRKLNLANRKDWRVPTYSELLTLVDYEKQQPASLDKIKYTQPLKYWTISSKIDKKYNYWYVDFSDGSTSFMEKQEKNKIRCVRDISKKAGDY